MTEERSASIIEMRPIRTAAERYDVAILGGGLAGLTLAIHLRRTRPDTSVVVLEKREGPAPLAAFKVGESTVVSGAHYFADVVGMRDHLEAEQLRKNGLRFFGPAGENTDITQRLETGGPDFPPFTTYQLDRGRFENELAVRARAAGVDLLQGCRVGQVTLGDDLHTVAFEQAERSASLKARWVVDAAGRASLLKRQLGLAEEVGHTINAAWFRLGGGLDIEQWGASNEGWMAKMKRPGIRMFSTNHLLGEGYWVWLIPLSSGPISIGVCADPRFHPFEEINELEGMLDWLRRHEPQLAGAVEPRVGEIEDFLRVENFAYGVERAFSPDRWCLIGEAAAFADPFLSPGSDMIAYSNTFTCDVIVRDLDGEDIVQRVEYYNDLYLRTFRFVLSRTEDFYPVFKNPLVTAMKLAWDTFHTHYGIVTLIAKNRLTDYEFMRSVDEDLDRTYTLNINIHRLFRDWHSLQLRPREGINPGLLGHAIHEALCAPARDYSPEELRQEISAQVRQLEALAVAIFHKAAASLPSPPDEEARINPYAVSLRPDDWGSGGLYDDDGLTLAEAIHVPGVDWLTPAAQGAPSGTASSH